MRKIYITLVASAFLSAASGVQADSGAQVGVLTCSTAGGGSNWVLYSETDVTCRFETPDGQESYTGTLHLAGLDLTFDSDRQLNFAVLEVGTRVAVGDHALAGDYAGAEATAGIGVEGGAAVLMGGSDDGIALQPLGISSGTGTGLKVGGSWLELAPAGT
jgi:hypothetical protein